MFRSMPLAVLACAAASCAVAQTASVEVSHTDPNGIVQSGETIGIRVVVRWEGALQFAGLKGDALATDSLGQSQNVGSAFGAPAPPLHVYGAPRDGDVIGHDIATVPAFFLGSPVPVTTLNTGADFMTYNWIAPVVTSPTLVAFEFVADPTAPNVRLYPNTSTPAFVEAQTTYIGTSILVIPAPAGLGAFAIPLGCAVLPRRRRATRLGRSRFGRGA